MMERQPREELPQTETIEEAERQLRSRPSPEGVSDLELAKMSKVQRELDPINKELGRFESLADSEDQEEDSVDTSERRAA